MCLSYWAVLMKDVDDLSDMRCLILGLCPRAVRRRDFLELIVEFCKVLSLCFGEDIACLILLRILACRGECQLIDASLVCSVSLDREGIDIKVL